MDTISKSLLNSEASFNIKEMFFSITKHDSTLLSGNEVFIRISGYSENELVGSFHNIIRHPDMPKVVFKAFWDRLNGNNPVVAYVKNRSKDGKYYWVLAAVFPLDDTYVSIRIKPATRFFDIVKELYPTLLLIEKEDGIEESERALLKALNGLGYENYDHFMIEVLLAELRERRSISLSSDTEIENLILSSPLTVKLQPIYHDSIDLMERYARWFEKINLFSDTKISFEEKGLKLRQLAREIVFLSLNASVSSYKMQVGGEIFGVLAHDIRINAKENEALITNIHEVIHELSLTLNEVIFSVSAIYLQIEMVSYFIKELTEQNNEILNQNIEHNMDTLVRLVEQYSKKLNTLLSQLNLQIEECLKNIELLDRQAMYLGYIQVYGLIEAASSKDSSAGFEGIFSQFKTLVSDTMEEVEEMRKMAKRIDIENRVLVSDSVENNKILVYLRDDMTVLMLNGE